MVPERRATGEAAVGKHQDGLLMTRVQVTLRPLLEKAVLHSSTLAWKIPWMEVPGGLQSVDSLSRTQLSDFTFTFHFSCIGEGNGNPLQCSCVETPRDGEPGGLPSVGSHRVGHD